MTASHSSEAPASGAAVRSRVLDGLRGVAVLPVLGYHFGARAFGGGWLGVDVFFVLSGYVVTMSLQRRVRSDTWSVGEYFWRRCARLLPIVVVAGIVVAATAALSSDRSVPYLDLLALVTMTYNVALELPGIDGDHLRHMWSLAVEWHFYVALPVLAIALRQQSERRILATLGSVALLTAIFRIAAVVVHPRPFFVYTLTFFRIDGLLLGVMVALSQRESLRRLPGWVSSVSVLGIALLLTVPQRWGESILLSMGLLIVIVNFLTAAIVAIDDGGRTPSPVRYVLESRILQWVGLRSYSLYVWHFIIGSGFVSPGDETYQGFGTFCVQVGASLIAAEVSYKTLEIPAQRWLNRNIPERLTQQSMSALD